MTAFIDFSDEPVAGELFSCINRLFDSKLIAVVSQPICPPISVMRLAVRRPWAMAVHYGESDTSQIRYALAQFIASLGDTEP